jgi:hypothetical protein
MSMSEQKPDTPLITPDDRKRLREGIDVAALERLLIQLPRESRRLILLACFRNVSSSELEPLGLKVPEGLTDQTPSRPGEHIALSDGRTAWRAPFEAARQTELKFTFDDPALQRLWEKVNASSTAS